MNIQKMIKILMIEKDVKIAELAEAIKMSPRSLSTKLSRSENNMTLSGVDLLLDALDCDLVIRDRATGKIYHISPTTPVGEIGEVDSGAVTPQNNSKKQKPTN